jgi:hypothetical protein
MILHFAVVLAGWSVGGIRSVPKGDNAQIGQEINQVRGQLAGNLAEPEPRMLRVGDGAQPGLLEGRILMPDRPVTAAVAHRPG